MQDVLLALELTLYGLGIVFAVLVLFLVVIVLLRKAFPCKTTQAAPAPAVLPAAAPAGQAASAVRAAAPVPVSVPPGEVELTQVDEPTAALILAIIAEQTGLTADELDVLSIRKVGTV